MDVRHLHRRRFVLAGAIAFGLSLITLPGCGGGGGNTETVVPDVPPEQQASDSMDWYKNNVAGKKKSVR